MTKTTISNILRKLGLLYHLDYLRFFYHKYYYRKPNRNFRSEHPDVPLPPDYLIYESYYLHYQNYYYGGRDTCQWLIDHFKQYKDLENIRVLDWGCGPGRVIRHMPGLLGPSAEVYGSDYNPKTIAWCKKNITGVHFSQNRLHPPLPFPDSHFDITYGISIFTHLSEKKHLDWYLELVRTAKPEGLIFLTTHGEAFKHLMSKEEIRRFDRGELVVREKVKEGHKVFGAFHPPSYLEDLFSRESRILKFIPGEKATNKSGANQDIWILSVF